MSNSYFRFQQFIVHQHKSAMKVCTDACLFGAWVADMKWENIHRVLDIGTGTGLLSLMFAQKNDVVINAVEIDQNAYEQARENFINSEWRTRLSVFWTPVQNYQSKDYDLIIVNPPFYDDDLKSTHEARNIALHSQELKLKELVSMLEGFLNDNGKVAILLPASRSTYAEKIFQANGLKISQKMMVRQTEKHDPFRIFYLLSLKETISLLTNEITIKDNGVYTEPFRYLLKDYYLAFYTEGRK